MRHNGVWLVLAAAVLWGTTGTAQALAPDGAGPAAIGVARQAVGGAALLVFALSRRAFARSRHWPIRTVLIAAACMAAYQLFFFAGVARTGVAVGTIVGIGSAPILAGAIGFLALGERPGRRWAVATLLAIAGCGLLIAAGRSIHVDPTGLLLATGAGASYASFTVASKDLLEHNPPEAVMAVIFCLGALLLTPLFFTADFSWLAQPGGLGVTLHLGLVTVALAYSLFARGLSQVPVATAATLTLAEPFTAGTLGVFLLGERLTFVAGFGILLIFTGLVLVSVRQRPASFPA
jgi:DME family drug/metabolite transporter